MSNIKKIVVLTSGGDAPGMNAALRAVVRTALHHNIDVFGAEMGFHGLIQQNIVALDARSVGNCIQRGGTLLKTGRCEEFKRKEIRDHVRQFLQQQHIDALVVLGGNGSFMGARLLADEGGPAVVGIPCTIDNDIVNTDYTIGFDTARNTALEAIDKVRDTAFSLQRNFIIEVMGRASGFLAVDVGIAGGAEAILIPEFPMSTDDIIHTIQSRAQDKLTSIIVAAEAGKPGHTIALAKDIKQKSGLEYKVCILGHTQRGGTPSAMDRTIASIMGAHAVEGLLAGESHKMVAQQQGKIVLTDFPEPKQATRYFTDKALLNINSTICDL